MREIAVFADLHHTIASVAGAILPLALFFIVFQILFLKLPRGYVTGILKGTALAAAGLILFVQGVHVGLLPFGRLIGASLTTLPAKALLAPFGFVLGFITTWGEPSVRILADQVQEASSGSIRQTTVVFVVSLGVAFIVGLGLLRIAYQIPLLAILIPGYVFIIAVMWFSDPDFLSIAIDSGGVATGPMANTFLLALALGVSSAMEGQEPIVHGLGLVAMIAMAPIISVIVLGLAIRFKEKRKE